MVKSNGPDNFRESGILLRMGAVQVQANEEFTFARKELSSL